MNVNDLFPSKYLKASDAEPSLTLTITKITQETMKNRDGKDETKPVLYFNEQEKGMVLNKTNARTLEKMFGSETEQWLNERVVLASAEVDAFGETQKALRFREEMPTLTKAELLKRYQKLYEEARKLEVDNLETYQVAADADETTIIELGKELRKAVEAAKTF